LFYININDLIGTIRNIYTNLPHKYNIIIKILGSVFMGLFSKKSDEQKKAENKIDELCGGFLGNETFQNKLEENNLEKTAANGPYKNILKNEIKNKTLNYEDIESRLDELMKLDAATLDHKIRIRHKQDTSLFKTQQDINDFMGSEYVEKYNKSLNDAKTKNLEKERKEEEKRIKDLEKQKEKERKEEEKRIKDLEKQKEKERKEEEKRIKDLEKQKEKIRKLEEKFNVDLTGKQWFRCTIEEVKYSTFNNEPRRNVDTAYVIINNDYVEILKESVFIKSNMGSRKLFYDNITSIDFDARGRLHASSSMIINTKSAEHIQLKYVSEENYNLVHDAFENYIKKPSETTIISQSSKAEDLVKYAELFEKGLISEEDFNKLKTEIIHGESNHNFNEDANPEYKEENNNFCTNCGSKVENDAKFCQSCGNKLN